MEIVTSVGHYCELVDGFKQTNGRGYESNLLFSTQKVDYLVKRKRLYFQLFSKCVLFFVQSHGAYLLYYFAASMQDVLLPQADGIYLEIVERETRAEEKINALLEKGFALQYTYMQMSGKAQEMSVVQPCEKNNTFYFFVPEHPDKILVRSYLEEAFNPIANQLPEADEWDRFFENMQFIMARDNKIGKDIGFLLYSKRNNITQVEFVMIHKDYRQMGMAEQLYRVLFENENATTTKHMLWVDIRNYSSIALHTKMGYIPNGTSRYLFAKTH